MNPGNAPAWVLLGHLTDETLDLGRVVGRPAKDFWRQKRRNARRCQAITVSGLTRTKDSFQPLQ
jgi:hypothetical protein